MAAPQGPLVGLRVLDFTIYANGPSATQKLCDGGAEVVKVEVAEGAPERIQSAYITPRGWNPRVIYTSNSGFGPAGEWAEWVQERSAWALLPR